MRGLSPFAIVILVVLPVAAFPATSSPKKFCPTLFAELGAKLSRALGSRTTEVAAHDFRRNLEIHGFRPELFTFEPILQRLGDGRKGILIETRYYGKPAGYFTMVYLPERNIFESHSHVEPDFRGKGIGLMLYAIGAKLSQKAYQSTLSASPRPSPDAQRVWEWILKNGWGQKSLLRHRPHFDPRVVEQNWDDLYSFFASRQIRQLPSIEELR